VVHGKVLLEVVAQLKGQYQKLNVEQVTKYSIAHTKILSSTSQQHYYITLFGRLALKHWYQHDSSVCGGKIRSRSPSPPM
jgi:hypothetical protein